MKLVTMYPWEYDPPIGLLSHRFRKMIWVDCTRPLSGDGAAIIAEETHRPGPPPVVQPKTYWANHRNALSILERRGPFIDTVYRNFRAIAGKGGYVAGTIDDYEYIAGLAHERNVRGEDAVPPRNEWPNVHEAAENLVRMYRAIHDAGFPHAFHSNYDHRVGFGSEIIVNDFGRGIYPRHIRPNEWNEDSAFVFYGHTRPEGFATIPNASANFKRMMEMADVWDWSVPVVVWCAPYTWPGNHPRRTYWESATGRYFWLSGLLHLRMLGAVQYALWYPEAHTPNESTLYQIDGFWKYWEHRFSDAEPINASRLITSENDYRRLVRFSDGSSKWIITDKLTGVSTEEAA